MITWAAVAFAGTLSGAVTDMSGAPVVDARVFAYDTRFTYGATRTDGSGRFVLGLPDEGYRVRVVPAQDSTLAERWWPEGYLPCEAERIDLVDDHVAVVALAVHVVAAAVGDHPAPVARGVLPGDLIAHHRPGDGLVLDPPAHREAGPARPETRRERRNTHAQAQHTFTYMHIYMCIYV